MKNKINLDNYKGYLEFFEKADKERTKQLNKIIHILGGSFLVAMIVTVFSVPIGIGIAIISGLYYTLKSIKLSKQDEISEKLKKEISEKYPDIDTELKYSELYKSLHNEGLIKSDGVKEVICEEEYLKKFKNEETKEFKITKDNYKGYLEYYQYESPEAKDKTFVSLGCGLLSIIILNIICKNNIIAARLATIIGAVATIGGMLFVTKKEDKKTRQKFEEKYPYLDWNMTDSEIVRALEKAKIIKYEGSKMIICEEEILDDEIQKEVTQNEQIKEEIVDENLFLELNEQPEKSIEKVKKLTKSRDKR